MKKSIYILIIVFVVFSLIMVALRGGTFNYPGGYSVTVPGPSSVASKVLKENSIDAKHLGESKIKSLIKESIAKQEATGNIINNGDFKIPLGDNLSKWGHGLYSDRIKAINPNVNFVWVNFLNADITISIEETELGNALKIVHKSEEASNRVGLMEQRLHIVPGKYRLSFWAKKLDDFQGSALWLVTRDDWVITGKNGYDLNKKGSFGWEFFSKEIETDKNEDVTFSIVSTGRSITYITDISFIKQ